MATKSETTPVADINQIDPALLEQIKAQAKEEALAEIEATQDKDNASQDAVLATNEANLALAEKSMKEKILAEPKRKIFIPRDPSNPDERQAIVINGVIFSVAKGKMVEVPEPVAAAWEYSAEMTDKAMAKIKVSNITNQNDFDIE